AGEVDGAGARRRYVRADGQQAVGRHIYIGVRARGDAGHAAHGTHLEAVRIDDGDGARPGRGARRIHRHGTHLVRRVVEGDGAGRDNSHVSGDGTGLV